MSLVCLKCDKYLLADVTHTNLKVILLLLYLNNWAAGAKIVCLKAYQLRSIHSTIGFNMNMCMTQPYLFYRDYRDGGGGWSMVMHNFDVSLNIKKYCFHFSSILTIFCIDFLCVNLFMTENVFQMPCPASFCYIVE